MDTPPTGWSTTPLLNPPRPPPQPKPLKRRRKKKKKRELERLQQRIDKEYKRKRAELEELEQQEKIRYEELQKERGRERVLRQIQIMQKVDNSQCRYKEIQATIKEQEEVKERELREKLQDRKLEMDMLSTKNPAWPVCLKGHSRDVMKLKAVHQDSHTKELKQLLRQQYSATPVYLHANIYEKYIRDAIEQQYLTEHKKEEAAMNSIRRKRYGALVREMYQPAKKHPGGLLVPIPFAPRRPSMLGMKERNAQGVGYLRSVHAHVKKKEEPKLYMRNDTPPPPEVAARRQGDENMKRALRWSKHPAPGPPPAEPTDPNTARLRILEISKKTYPNKGWDDVTLRSFVSDGVCGQGTEDALAALCSNTDALMEVVNCKVELLKHIDNKE